MHTPEDSRAIDEELKQHANDLKREVKVLLFGPDEQGKSAFRAQLRSKFIVGFTQAELSLYKDFVHGSILGGFRKILLEMDKFKMEPSTPGLAGVCDTLRGGIAQVIITPELAQQLIFLWNDPVVGRLLEDSPHLNDDGNSFYFFCQHLERCFAANYVPTPEDVSYLRSETARGLTETSFAMSSGLIACVVDVGGSQRNTNRRKWFHCFDDVGMAIFVVSVADYDLMMEEDLSQNRLLEWLEQFRQFINDPTCSKKDILLLLNKKDVLAHKLKRAPITACFKDFPAGKDPHSYEDAVEHVKKVFQDADQSEPGQRRITMVETCMSEVDSATMLKEFIMNSLKEQNVRMIK